MPMVEYLESNEVTSLAQHLFGRKNQQLVRYSFIVLSL